MARCIFACLLIGSWCHAAAAAESAPVTKTPGYPPGRVETNVRDLNPASVTGCLGKPLGSRIIIDGIMAKGLMMCNPLALSAIDGRQLKEPYLFEIRGLVLQEGTRYRLEGYESGEFAGSPSWFQPQAQQFFHFSSFFVVTKVIEPKPEH